MALWEPYGEWLKGLIIAVSDFLSVIISKSTVPVERDMDTAVETDIQIFHESTGILKTESNVWAGPEVGDVQKVGLEDCPAQKQAKHWSEMTERQRSGIQNW